MLVLLRLKSAGNTGVGGGAGARDSSGEPPQGRPVLDCEGPRPGREPGCGGWPGS